MGERTKANHLTQSRSLYTLRRRPCVSGVDVSVSVRGAFSACAPSHHGHRLLMFQHGLCWASLPFWPWRGSVGRRTSLSSTIQTPKSEGPTSTRPRHPLAQCLWFIDAYSLSGFAVALGVGCFMESMGSWENKAIVDHRQNQDSTRFETTSQGCQRDTCTDAGCQRLSPIASNVFIWPLGCFRKWSECRCDRDE